MATRNMNMNEIGESSTNQDSHFISASRIVLPEFSGVYINPKESISGDEEFQRLQMDSNSETPDRYPHAPQTSPIDIKNYQDNAVFEAKLRECLKNLPNILVSSEERWKEESPETLRFLVENPIRSNIEVSTPIDFEVTSDTYKEFKDYFENINGTCSKKSTNAPITIHLADYCKNESAETFSIAANYQMEKLDLLRVDSDIELNTDLYRRSTLSDKESMIVNWGSDVSDISTEDECESSDDDSSCASRDRIEFEALALDSVVNPNIIQRLQQWKIRAETFSIAADYQMEKLDLLRVDSDIELNTDLYRRSTLSDKESMIVNWGSDVSDISTEDECESSDDDSSCASRDRIEFEALALDSMVNPNIIQRLH